MSESLKIKLDKAKNLIKNEGLISGGRRIAGGLSKMLSKIGSGDILFITNGVGDSARYRAHHVAEELSLHGFKCSVAVQDNPLVGRSAGKFKIFAFHRVVYTESVRRLISDLKSLEKEIIFEADDLIFDPRHIKDMEYYQNAGAVEKKEFEKGIGSQILNDPYVKACTTTTAYLADILKVYGKKVFVVPNKLSEEDLGIINNLFNNKQFTTDNKIRIGYFSGTRSHDRDFATITEPLINIMEKYPEAELVLAGPLEIDQNLASRFAKRIRKLPFAGRKEHFFNIASVDINLAPLETVNPFCESKSELKFFEAGILGVPTVAAATRTFKEAITDGLNGFVSNSANEWKEKITRLINEESLRKTMGEKAREKSLANYTNKNSHNEEYYSFLRSILKT